MTTKSWNWIMLFKCFMYSLKLRTKMLSWSNILKKHNIEHSWCFPSSLSVFAHRVHSQCQCMYSSSLVTGANASAVMLMLCVYVISVLWNVFSFSSFPDVTDWIIGGNFLNFSSSKTMISALLIIWFGIFKGVIGCHFPQVDMIL